MLVTSLQSKTSHFTAIRFVLACAVSTILSVSSAAAFECPKGTVVIGQPPPDGEELYCARAGAGEVKIKHGPFRQWHPTGEKKTEGNYTLGEKDGTWLYFHNNGQLAKREHFQRGIRAGKLQEWFPNGNKKIEEDYRKGKRQGLRRAWNLDGNPTVKVALSDGRKVGPAQFWHKNGKVKSVGFFDTSSKRDGLWSFFNKSGERTSEGRFRSGKKDGTWRNWNNDGTLHSIVEFKDGKKLRSKKSARGEGDGKAAKGELTTIPETSSDRAMDRESAETYRGSDAAEVNHPVKTTNTGAATTGKKGTEEPKREAPKERRTYHELLEDWQKEKGIAADGTDASDSPRSTDSESEPSASPEDKAAEQDGGGADDDGNDDTGEDVDDSSDDQGDEASDPDLERDS